MVASGGACLNHTQVTTHRDFRPHFDNSERPAGMDLCIYCVVGFGFRFSPPIWGVGNPRGAVATWLGGKAFPRLGKGNRIRESRSRPTPHSPKAIRSIACGDEAKIYLRHQTLSDFCFPCVVSIGTANAQPGERPIILGLRILDGIWLSIFRSMGKRPRTLCKDAATMAFCPRGVMC
jgi:hypothetical protein